MIQSFVASMSRAAASLALALWAIGCASGTGVNPRQQDGGPRDAAAAVDTALPCDPVCAIDEVCVEGVCHPATSDLDHDGVPAATDCDDANASVGSVSERSCSSSCGTGVERCTDGVWATCTAPTTCDCTDGEPPRTIACMHCGMQQQVCSGGVWTDSGLCVGGGPCSPGDVDMGGTCGNCGTLARTCMTDCTWGAWGCSDEGVCAATDVPQSESQSCGTCGTGTQMRTRSCDATTCQWGTWSGWGTCSGGEMGTCSPGQTDMQTQACPGGCANQTRTRSCDTAASCTWGTWSSWSTCPSCGPVCGNSSCESGETCSSCSSDCRYGQGGNGNGGDSCAGVPAETWRCVHSSSLGGNVSQVCRSGSWLNFNFNPRNCGGCFCGFSSSCCQSGSTSSGC